MGSFTCPHLRMEDNYCQRLKTDCVPGRPGCILPDDTTFETSWQERLEKSQQQKQDDTRSSDPVENQADITDFFRD